MDKEQQPIAPITPPAKKTNIAYLTRLSVLTALLVVMDLTGIGYIRIGTITPIEITIMMIPVIAGAILLDPLAGLFLGGVFGLMSFFQCFGRSAFGVFLFGISPILTFVLCMIPRMIMGLMVGFIYRAIHTNKKKLLPYIISSVSGALLNTLLFVIMLIYFFGNNNAFLEVFPINSIIAFFAAFVGLNSLIEIIVCALFGAILSRIARIVDKDQPKKTP